MICNHKSNIKLTVVLRLQVQFSVEKHLEVIEIDLDTAITLYKINAHIIENEIVRMFPFFVNYFFITITEGKSSVFN